MKPAAHYVRVIVEHPTHAWSRLTFLLWRRHRFGRVGQGTWIGRPTVIINGAYMTFGARCFIREEARLEVVARQGLPPGRLVVGDRANIEQNAHIVACSEIVIEEDVCIGPRCTIVDTSHILETPNEGNRAAIIDGSNLPIRIGRRVFLGANVVVLRGVTIGANSVIGANAVVTSDIPPNSVAVGIPARVIRTLDDGKQR